MTLKRKTLVISPAGRVYDHDCVEWWPNPLSRIVSEYFNIGDMAVHDSTLKLLDYDRVQGVVIERLDEGLIEWYKTFDRVIIRASNFIHNLMDWQFALEIIQRINLPVYVVGVGAQSSGGGDYLLNEHNLAFWKEVSSRCKSIGVRGEFTANLLAKNNIKNVEIVGCPTIFRTRNRALQLHAPEKIESVAFSIRREADATYTPDIKKYLGIQRNVLLDIARKFDTTLTIHGEPEEKAFYFHDLRAQLLAEKVFMHEGWWTEESREEMRELYRSRLFFFLKVADYDEFIVSKDIAVGYRVHGVLPAIANGVPGLLLTYDSRSGELARTHKIPAVSVDESPIDIVKLMGEVDYSEFNRQYSTSYDNMRAFLNSNEIPNRM